jgi:hypothetical protein
MVSINRAVVEDTPNNPEVKGLSPMEAEGTGRNKMAKNLVHRRLTGVAQW